MFGAISKSKNSITLGRNAGTLENSGISSMRTGFGSVLGPELGPNSSGNNNKSSDSTKKKSNKNLVALSTGNPSANRILGNPLILPDFPGGTILAQARSVKQVHQEAMRRATAEAATREVEDAIRNHDMGSQRSLFTPLYTP
jgi:hypothetical protein